MIKDREWVKWIKPKLKTEEEIAEMEFHILCLVVHMCRLIESGATLQIGESSRRGRRFEEGKRGCIALCNRILFRFGKNSGMHRTGSVVKLARWVWVCAGGDDMSTLNAWGALAEDVLRRGKAEMKARNRKWKGNTKTRRRIKWASLRTRIATT